MAMLSFKSSAITWCSSSEARIARAAEANVKASVPIKVLTGCFTQARNGQQVRRGWNQKSLGASGFNSLCKAYRKT